MRSGDYAEDGNELRTMKALEARGFLAARPLRRGMFDLTDKGEDLRKELNRCTKCGAEGHPLEAACTDCGKLKSWATT